MWVSDGETSKREAFIRDLPKLAGATRDDHEAWAAGKATPFLPGPSVNTLILQPAGSSRSRQGLETDHRKRSGLRADDVAH